LRNALVLLAALSLGACSPGQTAKPAEDPQFAGLEAQILSWRGEVAKTSEVCTQGGGCQDFEVACKAQRAITPDDAAKGVTAKVVVAMTFNPKAEASKPGAAYAEFIKAKDAWTRVETKPVSPSTCADF
jgi:hypothetical protein